MLWSLLWSIRDLWQSPNRSLAGHKITRYGISGLEIKNSTGISRGKSDKIDAQRIADYGVRFADKLKPYSLCDKVLSELKGLNTKRSQLVKLKSQLTQANGDNKNFKAKIFEKLSKIDEAVVKALIGHRQN
ncbi:MAG: transposase [Saprospiraceae bacterium]|nr:transposase [Saprospiraceae bacterium]